MSTSRISADFSALDDSALVTAFLAGERAAFDVIVTRHQRHVYQVCYRFVRHHEDAADLAQDVFVRAFKGLRGFKGEAQLRTWLHRVSINVCLNRLANKRVTVASLDADDHVDQESDDPFRALARSDRAGEVRKAIAQLPTKQRATVLLRVYQELSHQEIADVLGSSVGAVKVNFFHALANLKRLLQP